MDSNAIRDATTVPCVSVIVPTYNRAGVLSRALDSVLRQTYDSYEVIVVDDGSTDETEKRIRELSRSYSSISYVKHETNRGGAAARNTGIRKAKGEYLAFLDSDDEWLPDKLSKQMAYFSGRENKQVALYNLHYVKEGNLLRKDRLVPKRGMLYKELLSGWCISWLSSCVVSAEMLKTVGGFDESLSSMQDYDFWLSISKYYPSDYVNEYLVVVHEDAAKRVSLDIEWRTKGIDRFFSKWEPEIEKEVGRGMSILIRNRYLSYMYYYALRAAIFERSTGKAWECLHRLRTLNGLSVPMISRILLALPGERFFNSCKSLAYKTRMALR